jgi:glycosyltransferase involved in cell wall biosynthesis
MKICIISLNLASYFDPTPRARYGGAEVQAAFVARALEQAGQDVQLVVADLPSDHRVPYPTRNAFHSGVGAPVLRFFHPRVSGIFHALAEADADVYYQHCAGMVTGLTAHVARKTGRVFVYGAGSDTDFSFRNVLIHGMRDRVIYYYGLRRAHGVVAQSRRQLEWAEKLLKSPVVMIPTGVLPAQPIIGERSGAILWAGGLRAVKRPDLLIELARRMPDREFVLVGGGTTTEPDYAAAITEEAAAVANVRVTGWLPHSDVIREIERASLVVNTSSYEGFPNVYLEAWNYGVPVISFNDVDGMLAQGQLGALCANLDEMEATIRALFADPDRLAAMRVRVRQVVAERFSPAVLGPLYVQFFESLLGKR